MFWNRFVKICTEKNTTPTAVVKKLGISIGSITKWKNGSIPNSTTILKIANYFDLSPEYLCGTSDTPNFFDEETEDNQEIEWETKMVIIAKKTQQKGKKIIAEKTITQPFTEENEKNEKNLIPFEDYYPDDQDNSLEKAIATIYIEYLRSIDIPVTCQTHDTILHSIKNILNECKKIAKKDKPISITEIFSNQKELSIQEKTLLEIFRSTTELGKQRIIQSTWNIHDEIEKKHSQSNQGNAG